MRTIADDLLTRLVAAEVSEASPESKLGKLMLELCREDRLDAFEAIAILRACQYCDQIEDTQIGQYFKRLCKELITV